MALRQTVAMQVDLAPQQALMEVLGLVNA